MRGEPKTNHKSNITISVDNSIFDEIKKDAQNNGLSINAHLSDILQQHIVFYRHVREQGGVILPQKVCAEMINLIDEDKLRHLIDESGGDDVASIFEQNGISFTIDNLIKYLFERISLWAGAYSVFRYHKEGSNIELVFEHKLGIKWSKTLGYVFSRFIHKTTGCTAIFKASFTTITIKVNCP